jgi:hypothetical protein
MVLLYLEEKMYFKDGKWAREILDLQHQDGSWGYFHTLTKPTSKQPLTTEQALRRLEILGYTINDKPIKKAVKYLQDCLTGKNNIPDRAEKQLDWEKFKDLMISTWIRRFIPDDKRVNDLSKKWAEIVNGSFVDDAFSQSNFDFLFYKVLGYDATKKAIRFMTFYPISLVANNLSKDIEPVFFKHILDYDKGITYFNYAKPLKLLPRYFDSKETSAYIREIEFLTEYKKIKCKKQLLFVKKWILNNKLNDNEWDMGKESKDGIYFPLSDSWKLKEDRIKDCTYRLNKLLEKI